MHKLQFCTSINHRRGNDVSVGGGANDFSDGEAKIGEKQSRQWNSKYNFMQYVYVYLYFSKNVYNGVWGKAPEAGEF